jgi:hypothetical protein
MVAAMKQGNASNAMMDLDDLDRQLKAASSAPRRAGADDPLAELARIVGQEDPLGGSAAARKPLAERIALSFDDFLKVPPRPASGDMPSHTPPVEPLFADHKAVADLDRSITGLQPTELPVPAVQPEELSLELGLRPALPMEAEPAVAIPAVQSSDAEILNELEARLAAAMDGEAGTPVVHQPIELPTAEPIAPSASNHNFDDMLAEFDAAMRDVGAEKLPPQRTLEEIIVPPPPPASYIEPSGPGMAAAGAAVVGAGAIASAAVVQRAASRPRRGLMIAGGVIAVALIGIGSLMTFGAGSRSGSAKDAPVIAAKPGVTKERPANPGGVEVPNQDKEVLRPGTAQPRQAERVAPREEQPVDLNQAQRAAQAEAQAASGAVRQIPGVSIVAPISTTPPAGAPAQPVPRPVASVPITITGQPPLVAPPAAPVAPAPVVAAPAAPATPSAPPAQAAAPAAPTPAAQTPAAAEPRRVRAVPIRPDEGAPTRAQAQPRVVPANPRPAPVAAAPEPEDANAPLRITPQAGRPTQRAATAIQPGTVPSSSPAPQTTQTATATAPSASGSGFTVQLAAEGSEDAARAKFNRMRGQYSDTLGSQSPNIRSAEVNGRSVYRVRVGNMSREEAVSLCEKLKSDGGSCFVARN